MRRIFMHCPDEGASGYYRARLPVEKCTAYCKGHGVELYISKDLHIRPEYDVYILHRFLKGQGLQVLKDIKAAGKEVWHEIDDDYWHIPGWNPASVTISDGDRAILDETLDLADRIIVSTEALKEVVARQDKTWVCPNLVDISAWKPVQPRDGKLRVLWSGSVHHDGDLLEIVEPLEQLMSEYKDVDWLFFGDMPEKLTDYVRIKNSNLGTMVPARHHPNMYYIQPVPFSHYHDMMTNLKPDIGLAPLQDIPFNDSKSGIKYYEYTLAGAATVCSDMAPYTTSLGLLVGDSSEWYAKIKRLLQEPELRQVLHGRSLHQVHQYHSWRATTTTAWHRLFTDGVR